WRASDDVPATRQLVGVDHCLAVGNGYRTGWNRGTWRGASRQGEALIVHAQEGCARGKAKHEHISRFSAVQRNDFVRAEPGPFSDIEKIGAVFPAVADGYLAQPPTCVAAFQVGGAQHAFYFSLQAARAGIGIEVCRQVMHGHRVEGGNDIADTSDTGLP